MIAHRVIKSDNVICLDGPIRKDITEILTGYLLSCTGENTDTDVRLKFIIESGVSFNNAHAIIILRVTS